MIHILRPPEPPFFLSPRVLTAKQDLMDHHLKPTQQRAQFRMDLLKGIKPELQAAFKNKCAYCESRLEITAHFEIDNFRPKGGTVGNDGEFYPEHYFWLAYEWNNLIPCCPACNRYKRNIFPLKNEQNRAPVGAVGQPLLDEGALLIDPCVDQPEEHLKFLLTGEVEPLTEKGSVTIKTLALNRKELTFARSQAASNFRLRLLSNDVPEIEIAELFSSSPTHEYTAVLREVVFDSSPKLPDNGTKKADIANNLTTESEIDSSSGETIELTNYYPDTKPFTIKTIEIKNFRTIEHLHLHIQPSESESERESWLMMLGDNGVGKSSILQAIALTLCGEEEISKLKVKPDDYLKNGQESGYVKVTSCEDPEPAELHFDHENFKSSILKPQVYLLGYGATRLLPKAALKYSKPTNPLVNVRNLFDYSCALNDVNSWLNKLDSVEFEKRIAPALFDLLDLKDGERLVMDEGRLQVQYDNGNQDFEKTSDGYKSMIALACDIMKTLSSHPAGYHAVHGIVLIDELGNHLHPRWRMKIAGALRTAFPRIQFIVSTHEPLCLRGVLHGEVVVLVDSNEGRVMALDKHVLPDHNSMQIDQLLTSDLFGLINVFDSETERRYEDYYRLLSLPKAELSAEDREQVEAYTRLFSSKELIGNTPQMQVLYQIVHEEYASNLLKTGFKTHESLKQDTIRNVKSIIETEKPDWL